MWLPALRRGDSWASKSPTRGFLRAPQDGLRAATGRPTAEAHTLAAGGQGAAPMGRRRGRGVCVGPWGLGNGGPWTEEVSGRRAGGGPVGWFGLAAFSA
jgi:hypothetical protein